MSRVTHPSKAQHVKRHKASGAVINKQKFTILCVTFDRARLETALNNPKMFAQVPLLGCLTALVPEAKHTFWLVMRHVARCAVAQRKFACGTRSFMPKLFT